MKPAPEGQQRVRTVAQRGKSMEELGALKLKARPSALSKSSEQLDQLRRQDKRSAAFFAEVREAQGQDRGRRRQNQPEQPGKERETKSTQGPTHNQTQRKSLPKQNSEPGEGGATVESNGSTSPTSSSSSSSRTRVHSGPGRLPAMDAFRPPSETSSHPPSPRGPDSSETEVESTSSTPTQTKPPCENRPSSR